MTDRLDRDRKSFEEALPRLLGEHKGEYVLFADGEVVGLYPNYDAAFSDALSRFGSDGVFLIQPIIDEPPQPISIAWEAGVAFG